MSVLRRQPNWESLYFYQKSQVLYQMTFVFAQRYLKRGDRTIDQMVQAARLRYRNNQKEEITRLQLENARLQEELELLKKDKQGGDD